MAKNQANPAQLAEKPSFSRRLSHSMNADLRYIQHFGLIAPPFQGISDRRFIWLGDNQLENLAHLKVGIEGSKGILLLLGEEGTGKSVLLGCLSGVITGDIATAVLREARISVDRFLMFLAAAFKLNLTIATKSDFLIHFRAFLLEAHSSGRKVLLIVEDAENQDDAVLEEIRLLSNIEEKGTKLLSVLLVGNSRLDDRLKEHRHRALRQRAAVRCQTDPLSEKETVAYIRHRMMVGGSFLEIFTPEAVKLIHRHSGGTPKMIDLICDHALMRGYFEKRRTIDGKTVSGYLKNAGQIIGGLEPGFKTNRSEARPDHPRRARMRSVWPAALVIGALFVFGAGIPLIRVEERPLVVTRPLPPPSACLYFEPGSKELATREMAKLDRIVHFQAEHPQCQIAIKGYTDSKGSFAHNMRISTERAETAKNYLVRRGVSAAKIQATGFAAEKPTTGVKAPLDQRLSRRVEVDVVTPSAK